MLTHSVNKIFKIETHARAASTLPVFAFTRFFRSNDSISLFSSALLGASLERDIKTKYTKIPGNTNSDEVRAKNGKFQFLKLIIIQTVFL